MANAMGLQGGPCRALLGSEGRDRRQFELRKAPGFEVWIQMWDRDLNLDLRHRVEHWNLSADFARDWNERGWRRDGNESHTCDARETGQGWGWV